MRNRSLTRIVLAVLLLIALTAVGCGKKDATPDVQPPANQASDSIPNEQEPQPPVDKMCIRDRICAVQTDEHHSSFCCFHLNCLLKRNVVCIFVAARLIVCYNYFISNLFISTLIGDIKS